MLEPWFRFDASTRAPVLFIGAGFSAGSRSVGGQPVPLGTALARAVAQQCLGYPPEDAQEATLATVAESAKAREVDGRARLGSTFSELIQSRFTIARESVTAAQRAVTSLPWARVYTVNVDDLALFVGERIDGKRYRRISAVDPAATLSRREAIIDWIHLNGVVEDPIRATFGESDFVRRLDERHRPIVELFAQDLATSPLLAIGSVIDEPHLWLALMRFTDEAAPGLGGMPPRSLVTLRIPRDRADLLRGRGFEIIQTGLDAWVEQEVRPLLDRRGWLDKQEQRRAVFDVSTQWSEWAPDIAAMVRPTPSDGVFQREAALFLLGQEPSWRTAAHAAVERHFESNLRQLFDDPGTGGGTVVAGGRGSGRSTFMRRLALRQRALGRPALWVDGSQLPGVRELLDLIHSTRDRPLEVFINDAGAHFLELPNLRSELLTRDPNVRAHVELRLDDSETLIRSAEGWTELRIPRGIGPDFRKFADAIDRSGVNVSEPPTSPGASGPRGRDLQEWLWLTTKGQLHEERMRSEYRQLSAEARLLYGAASLARHWLLAMTINEAISLIAGRDARKIIERLLSAGTLVESHGTLRTRNSAIAENVIKAMRDGEELASTMSRMAEVYGALVAAGHAHRSSERRITRMLRESIRHSTVLTFLGSRGALDYYADLQRSLAGNGHYWLHRALMEISNADRVGRLELARAYLDSADKFLGSDSLLVAVVRLDWLFARERTSRDVGFQELRRSCQYTAERHGRRSVYPWHLAAHRSVRAIETAGPSQSVAYARLADEMVRGGLVFHPTSLLLRELSAMTLEVGVLANAIASGDRSATARVTKLLSGSRSATLGAPAF